MAIVIGPILKMQTGQLGEIVVDNLTINSVIELEKIFDNKNEPSPYQIATTLLVLTGHRAPSGEGDKKLSLTEEDIAQMSEDELEEFARLYIKDNYGLLHEYNSSSTPSYRKIELPIEDGETNLHYLKRLMIRHIESFKINWTGRLESIFPSKIFSSAASRLLEHNITAASKLSQSLSFIDAPICPPVRKFNIPTPVKDPIHTTNERINVLVSTVENLKTIAKDSGELLESMNDLGIQLASDFKKSEKRTTRGSRILIIIGLVTLGVVAIFSYLSYYDSRTTGQKLVELLSNIEAIERSNNTVLNDNTEKLARKIEDLKASTENSNTEIRQELLGIRILQKKQDKQTTKAP